MKNTKVVVCDSPDSSFQIKINPVTLTIDCGDYYQFWEQEIVEYAKEILLRGKIPQPEPWWVAAWRDVCGFQDESQWLLMSTTVLPARLLLSGLM